MSALSEQSRGPLHLAWHEACAPTNRTALLGQELLARGSITEEQLHRALKLQRSTGRRLGETLVDLRALSSYDLTKVLADHLDVPFVELRDMDPDVYLSRLIPESVARRYRALAVERHEDKLLVAMANPNDVFAVDDIRTLADHKLVVGIAEPVHLAVLIDQTYGSRIEPEEVDDDLVARMLLDGVPHRVFEALDTLRPFMARLEVLKRAPGLPVHLAIELKMTSEAAATARQ